MNFPPETDRLTDKTFSGGTFAFVKDMFAFSQHGTLSLLIVTFGELSNGEKDVSGH